MFGLPLNANQASCRVIVDIPREKAWELLRDLSLAHNYVPGVLQVQITTSRKEGEGASRRVYQSKTNYINETVEEWIEGQGFLIRLHLEEAGPPFPFKEAWFRYEIKSEGERTELTTSLIYTSRWGATGRLLDRLILNRIISNRIRDIAFCLKVFWETGEPVTKKQLKQARAALKRARSHS